MATESFPSHTNLASLGVDELSKDEETPDAGHQDRTTEGGFGWVIVGCAFLAFSLMAINSVSYGVFITELEETFKISQTMIGALGACKLGLSTIAGLLGGPLTKRYGCRQICLVGVTLAAVGHLAAAFCTDVWGLLVTFGILAGAGAGVAFIPTVVIVQQYFVKRRAIAAGIASAGVSTFAIAFSPLTRLLIDAYGWRGAMLALSAANVQMFVPVALMRPPPKFRTPKVLPRVHISPTTCTTTDTKTDKLALPKWKHQENGFGFKMKTTSSVLSSQTFKGRREQKPRCAELLDCFDRSIMSPSFVLFLITSVTLMYSMDAFYLRSTPRAIVVGVSPTEASFLPSLIGFAGITGRGISGVIAKLIEPCPLNGIACTMSGVVVAVSIVVPHVFWAHGAFCVAYGIFFGICQGIQPTVVVSLIGVERLPLGMSWVLLVQGTGRVCANLLSGWLFDVTGNYSAGLLVSGLLQFMGGCAALLTAVLLRKKGDLNIIKKLCTTR